MPNYLIIKHDNYYFRRKFPSFLRFSSSAPNDFLNKSSFLVKSLRTSTFKDASEKSRVLKTFTDVIFERASNLVQVGAVHINDDDIHAIRQGMRAVCDAWLDHQQMLKALAGPLSAEQVLARKQEADLLVQRTQAALAANNHETVSDIFEEGMKRIGFEISDEALTALARHEALVAFNQAAIRRAEREMGHFRENYAVGFERTEGSNVVSFPSRSQPVLPAVPTPSYLDMSPAASEAQPTSPMPQVDVFSEWYRRLAENKFAVPGGNKRTLGREVTDPKSLMDFVNMRAEFIEVCGDKSITEYTHEDITKYVEWLAQVPVLHGKVGKNGSKKDELIATPSLQEQIEAADTKDQLIREELDAKVDSGELRDSEAELIWEKRSSRRLKATTINKRLSRLRKLFAYAKNDLRINANINLIDHVTPNRLKEEPVPRSYRKLSDHEIDMVFSHETYRDPQGCPKTARLKGVQTLSQFGYWSILFSFFSGMRLEEIGQMRVQDVKQRHSINFVQVGGSMLQSIKNDNANREVPIPQIILDLGFIDYLNERRNQGGERCWVFNELERDKRGKRTANFSSSYGRWRKKIGLAGEGKDFHAGRATFDTFGLNLGNTEVIMASILGHRLDGETSGTYNKGMALTVMKEAIDKVTYGYEVEKIGDARVLKKRADYQELFPIEPVE